MKPITYLCFTLLSIVIQLCLMDLIREQTGIDDMLADLNSTTAKNLTNMLKTLKQKPHALYYRTEIKKYKDIMSSITYTNNSLTETQLTASTELTSTVFDLLYDDNVSVTENDLSTETLFTSSELDNVTEITFFDTNPSTNKPTEILKMKTINKCYCNLLHQTCDVNCCCDSDCSDLERSMLRNCEDVRQKCDTRNTRYLTMCSSQLKCNKELQSDIFSNIFCIGKVNLPERLTKNKNTVYSLDVDNSLKWHITNKKSPSIQFTKDLYTIGQPVWVVRNDSVDYLASTPVVELPVTVTNEYCNGYKAIKFLINENIRCYVKLKDLHMLDVIRSSEITKVASPKTSSYNSTKMDCTTLHCINWIFLICDEHNCTKYQKDIHEPSCSESYCSNIGVQVEYEFYCNASSITRAIIKLHIRTVSMALQYVNQEVTIHFYMGNNSIDNVVKFSGNPGYIRGLPVIVSLSESNHTDNFYNYSLGKRNYLLLPYNKDGGCILSNLTHNIVKFGYNKRLKCRASFEYNFTAHNNGTDGCLSLQAKINDFYGVTHNMYISPYGNPQNVSDKYWLSLEKFNKSNIYGEYHPKDSKLHCFNLITRVAFIIAFADTNNSNEEENKILSAKVESTTKNVTFNIEDLSTVITIDISFIDVTKTSVHEYAGTPQVNFNIPKDFFSP